MQAVPRYMPENRSREAAYEKPSGVASSQAIMPVSQAPNSAYQISLQAFYVMQTVLENLYTAPRARVGGEKFACAALDTYVAPLHAARNEEVVGGGGAEPQTERTTDPYRPSYHSCNDDPSEEANIAGVQGPRNSESTIEAPLRRYHPKFCNSFARPFGFLPPTMPFTGGSSFNG